MQETELYIELFGRVQGVNLRRTVEKYCKTLGLTGYIENKNDGSTVIVAQGKEQSLQELLSWILHAPFPVKVSGLKYEWRNAKEKSKKFIIKTNRPFLQDEVHSIYNLTKEVFNNNEAASIPNHVVIIPDGNRRWARQKGWQAWVGHKKSLTYERIKEFFDSCKELGVKYLSFWGFSTENWDRDEREIKIIFDLFRNNVKKYREEFMKEGIRFRHMGRKDRLPKDLIDLMKKLEEETKGNNKLYVQLCLDYGGRDDLVRAINKMLAAGVEKVDEKLISEYLDSQGIPDPDLIIRTSGEKRTSGIMAYQATYAELYFTNVYFPDFDSEQFQLAILDYSARVRRFGGTAKADLKNIDVNTLVDPEEEKTKLALH